MAWLWSIGIFVCVVGGFFVLLIGLAFVVVSSVGTMVGPLRVGLTLLDADGRPRAGATVRLAHDGRAPWDFKEHAADSGGIVRFEAALMWSALGALELIRKTKDAPLPARVDVMLPGETTADGKPFVRRYELTKTSVRYVPLTRNGLDADGGDFTVAGTPVESPADTTATLTRIENDKGNPGWGVLLTIRS
jgi:hypothetical protein